MTDHRQRRNIRPESRIETFMRLPSLDDFVTSLYCEDRLDDDAFEIGLRAIREDETAPTDDVCAARLRRVVDVANLDGRTRAARQLKAALASMGAPLEDAS